MKLVAKDFLDSSRYLWTDLPGAEDAVRTRNLRSSPALLRHFIQNGYGTRQDAVDATDIARFQADLDRMLQHGSRLQATFWQDGTKHQLAAKPEHLEMQEAKILDVHRHVPTSHALIFSPTILAFLQDVLGEEPVAFQTLYFEYGSTQGAHNDTAFVYVDPPNQFVASWIALEDVEPGTGELFYYPGSHRTGDQIFANGGKAFDPKDEHAQSYSATLDALMETRGLSRATFLPKRGDVLFWTADLIHGGSDIVHRRTRRSLVTHYCPLSAAVPYARHLGIVPERVPQGGWIVSPP